MKDRIKHIAVCLLAGASLVLNSIALAEDSYDVEILVFSNEDLSSSTELLDVTPARAIEVERRLNEFRERVSSIRPASTNQGALGSAASRLSGQSAYNVVFHGLWRQPAVDRPESPLIPVLEPGIGISPDIEGYVRVYVSRNLIYADTFMRFTPFAFESKPLANTDSTNNVSQAPPGLSGIPSGYVIDEKRRIRFDEIHYMDHPGFGILLRVSRPPESSETASSQPVE